MCSRIQYKTGTGTYIVGRNADWNDMTARVDLRLFPKMIMGHSGSQRVDMSEENRTLPPADGSAKQSI